MNQHTVELSSSQPMSQLFGGTMANNVELDGTDFVSITVTSQDL